MGKILKIKKDRVLIVQGGYVAQSHSTQLNVQKKSNVLDKPKSNVLNSAGTKSKPKTESHSESNNNNDNDNHESIVSQQQVPGLTVSFLNIFYLLFHTFPSVLSLWEKCHNNLYSFTKIFYT